MFGRSKPKPFKPYSLDGHKRGRSMPRWLLWMSLGLVLGVVAVLYVQQNYLPERLTPEESARLTDELRRTQASLQETRAQLETTRRELDASQQRVSTLTADLAKAKAALQPLIQDVQLLHEVLPPDPRGGDLQIRAGRFYNQDNQLAYHVVLTNRNKGTFRGNVRFTVEGRYPNGRVASVDLDPINVTFDRFQNVHGTIPLPDGLYARQITVRVVDNNDSTRAVRIINARS